MRKRPIAAVPKHESDIPLSAEFPIRLAGFPLDVISDQPVESMHGHGCLEIGLIQDGSGVFFAGGKVLRFRGGDLVVLPPGVFHRAQSTKGTTAHAFWLYLDSTRLLSPVCPDADRLLLALAQPTFRNVVSGRHHPELADLVRAIVRELNQRQTDYRACVQHLAGALLTGLNRQVPADAQKSALRVRRRQTVLSQMAPALNILSREYARDIGCPQLAKACHASPTNFRRLFRKAFSKSPKDYLTHLRIQIAAGMLEHTDLRILEISLDCGFLTLSSFNRHFKRILGVAPRDWRKRGRA
jgi:AraC-like DNA-binding protein